MASSSTNLNMGITNDKTSLGNDLKRKNNMQSPQGCMRGREKKWKEIFTPPAAQSSYAQRINMSPFIMSRPIKMDHCDYHECYQHKATVSQLV